MLLSQEMSTVIHLNCYLFFWEINDLALRLILFTSMAMFDQGQRPLAILFMTGDVNIIVFISKFIKEIFRDTYLQMNIMLFDWQFSYINLNIVVSILKSYSSFSKNVHIIRYSVIVALYVFSVAHLKRPIERFSDDISIKIALFAHICELKHSRKWLKNRT